MTTENNETAPIEQEDSKPLESVFSEEVKEESTVNESKLPDSGNTDIKSPPSGYRTYEQWVSEGRDPDEYKGRKVYEKQGEVYSALIEAQHQLKAQGQAIQTLSDQNRKVEELAYKRAKEQLKTEAMEAASIGNVAKVGEITEKLSELERGNIISSNIQTHTNKTNGDDVFATMNPWYSNPKTEEDYRKIKFAQDEDKRIAQDSQSGKLPSNLTMAQHFSILSERIENAFSSPTKNVSPVITNETGNKVMGSSTDAKKLMDSLSSFHKNAVKQIMRVDKKFSTADLKRYVEQVKKIEGE